MHFNHCIRAAITIGCSVVLLAPAAAESPSEPRAQTPTDLQIPPEPMLTYTAGMTPEQRKAAFQAWQGELKAWRQNLSQEQKDQVRRTRDERRRSLNEQMEKGLRLPNPEDNYDWRASANERKLDEATTEQLAIEKLAYGKPVKQSFQPYLRGPVFITSDSILNGFHVLFEDTFRELEIREAGKFRSNLEAVLEQARRSLQTSGYSSAETGPGWRHVQLVAGPALVILGARLEFFDADVRAEIRSQVEKIKAAAEVELPSWLGPESPSLVSVDYRRLKPVGFYNDDARLMDYFRAIRWLQMIPFRADRPVELAAIGMLGNAVNEAYVSESSEFFRDYGKLLGDHDDPDLKAAAHEFQNFFHRSAAGWPEHLEQKQRWLLRKSEHFDEFATINSDDRLPPDAQNRLAEIRFRIVSGYRFRDSVVLQELANLGLQPQGLAVAAMLDSTFARERLVGMTLPQFDAALATAQRKVPAADDNRGRSVYDEYLDVLRLLQAPAPQEAPELFRSRQWRTKSCQTVLASWAQMRHTFTLQAKQSAMFLGVARTPPGFVEPNPEFFGGLADLVARTKEIFESRGCFLPAPNREAARLRSDADFLESLDQDGGDRRKLSDDEEERFFSLMLSLEQNRYELPGWRRSPPEQSAPPAEHTSFRRDFVHVLRSTADKYENGDMPAPYKKSTTASRWETLVEQSRRLESLAQKQLSKKSWTESENAFLKKYGERLAFVMGYFGNSWLSPADDAPRWVEIHRNPQRSESLAVAIGRPRLLYVLYPWNGVEILCSGSVLPYYEYTTSDRLTDQQWLKLLDSNNSPPLPTWMQKVMQEARFTPDDKH